MMTTTMMENPFKPAKASFTPGKASFTPAPEALLSFLVNAMYLVDSHRILAWDGAVSEVTAELTRSGHRVDLRGNGHAGYQSPARYDRAVSVNRAFGYESDAENAAWLRSMYRALRPGGLLCFHVIDRDRAWTIANEGDRALAMDDGFLARADGAGFDPATGRLSFRVAEEGVTQRLPRIVQVRTFNLPEIRSLLEAAGFVWERAYGDWDAANPSEGGARTGRLIIVAGKPRRARAKTKVTR